MPKLKTKSILAMFDPTTLPRAISDELFITALDATKIADGTVTSTEFQYINTLASNAQTQLDTKATKGFSIAMGVALG